MNETFVVPPMNVVPWSRSDLAVMTNLPGRGLFTVIHALPFASVNAVLVRMLEMLEKVAVFWVTSEKLAISGETVNVIGLPLLTYEV
jgi:hypothetical protein